MLLNYWYVLVTLCLAGRALSEETVYKTVTAADGDNGGRVTTIATSDKHHLKDGLQKATSKIDKFFNGVTVTKTMEASSTTSSTRAPTARKDISSSTSSSTSSSSTSSWTSKTTSSSTTSSTTSKTTSTSSTPTTTSTSKIDPVKSALDYLTATTTTTNSNNDKAKATSTKTSGANRLKIGCW